MIILKKLIWNNVFSYGKNNSIQFDKDPIVQLVGKNGHGKSSIALILEEVLFNKNSKGIKKADILNRHIKDKIYSIELEFEKDGEVFLIKTTRSSTQTVSLFKNGENISAHTATSTFKLIEDIIGLDHKAFSQLVYQSSGSSLEFLTATDTNRKKFLIDLLNLNHYIKAFEIFKAATKEVSDEVLKLETSIKTTQAWLDKSLKEDLTIKPLKELPEAPDPTLEQEYYTTRSSLESIETTNKKIAKNNTYRKQLETIDLSKITSQPVNIEDPNPIITKQGESKKVISDANALITKISKLNGTCPTCLQTVDRSMLDNLVKEQEKLKQEAQDSLIFLNDKLVEINELKREKASADKLKQEWENYHSLIDNSLPIDLLEEEKLENRIKELGDILNDYQTRLLGVNKLNTSITAHNSKVQVILDQMDDMKKDLEEYYKSLEKIGDRLSVLQILQKTFSTSGLLAYKIECLVKELEDLTNQYLAELSDGRFQLMFKVSASDKLNVIITDNGKDIEINALSGGERARVNTATLLAIRKLMQSLSNAKINLLILDETIDSLDIEGKEKLIEVLHKEQGLNTYLVSHGYTHPLLEKITVIKEHNISRLE